MTDRVLIDFDNHIARVTLNRHDKMNALDMAQIEAIVEAGQKVAELKGLRAVVLQGGPRAFCAGLDMGAMASIAQDAAATGFQTRTHGISNIYQATAMVWAECPVPVIAALRGHTYGGGFQIAMGADIRVAAPDARFSIMEAKWGLIPDMGGMLLTRNLLRPDVAKRLTYTAEVFDADAALGWGVVTEIDTDPETRAMAIAEQIATRSPDAVRAAKALFAEVEQASPAETLAAESRVQAELIGAPNQMESVMAGLQKRAPNFTD